MSSSRPRWRLGLEPNIRVEAVYQAFRDLLQSYLPMSQEKLADQIGKNRTTVNRWGSEGSSEWKAGLKNQRSVLKAVRERLQEITEQVTKVQEMIEALEYVKETSDELIGEFFPEHIVALAEANDRVRALLQPDDE